MLGLKLSWIRRRVNEHQGQHPIIRVEHALTMCPSSQLGRGQRQGFDPCLNLLHGGRTVLPSCTLAQHHQARHYGCTQLSK